MAQWVIDEFLLSHAVKQGHFILSSGLHTPTFLQKMLVFQYPERTERLCNALAKKLAEEFGAIDVIVSIATGGIIPGYETARCLGARAIFVEKENDNTFKLRRGFTISKYAKVVILEDIVTTGHSINLCIEALSEYKGNIIGIGCLIDRSNDLLKFGVPFISLATYDIPTYNADALPPELVAIPAIRPGS
jgi:orotate phosphoribosyltransferase